MTDSNRVRLSKLSLALFAALAAAPVFAQTTSAALGGRVVGADGQPVAGAEVTITHAASGTSNKVVTDADGRYNARGLRVGGPYTVTVTKAEVGTDTESNVYLGLSESNNINLNLAPATLDTVTVVGTGYSVFSPNSMGAGTNVNSAQLGAFPSIKRDLQDYARMDPRLSQTDKDRGEISAGGQNSRYNSITVDGVTINDTFGLESNNLPTEKQPISIDSIEEVQVNVANYDVTQTRYTGANVNAVTKSGTNEFKGSLYYIFRDGDWFGDYLLNTNSGQIEKRKFVGFKDEKTYGMTFGGPLIKDRLFFFTNYEKFIRTSPGSDLGPAGSGAPTEISRISVAEVNEIINVARNTWGFDPGTIQTPSTMENQNESWLAKLDWNINDDHRASLRHQETEQSFLEVRGQSSSSLSLSSHWHNQAKKIKTTVAQLYSDWSDMFSTEARLSYRDYTSIATPLSRLPAIAVDVGGATVNLGTEQFRHANEIQTKTLNAYFAGDLFVGDHVIKAGLDYESNEVFNYFIESKNGTYNFASINDFRNGVYSPNFRGDPGYTLRTPVAGLNPAAEYTLDNWGLFLQDTWSVSPNLTLLFGVRADIPKVDDKPAFNDAASAYFGFRNDATIDGNYLIQPRFGFNYTFDTERRTQVRGGVGLFQGAAASVWLANPYTNNGRSIAVYTAASGTGFNPNPDTQVPPAAAGAPAADIDFIDPDLEQPSVWKANLAVDHELPWWGTVASAELVLTSVESGIHYQHLNLGAPTGIGQDGRLMYWSNNSTASGSRANRNRAYREVLLATPTNKGEGQQLTLSLQKPMQEDWSWTLAYTYTEATEVNPLTSSRSISNWQNNAVFNPNEAVSGRSAYVVRDRFNAAINWQHAFFGDYKTQVGLFYEGRAGKPYSWTYINDMNGDGTAGNDLMYIPDNRDGVAFVSDADRDAFWAYVSSHKEFNGAFGGVIERNNSASPWTNTFDLRISQELPGFFKGNKAEIWVDVLNIGNMINKKWGAVDEILFDNNRGGNVRSIVNYRGMDAQGRYIYDFDRDEAFRPKDRIGESRWSLQVGFRYKF